MSKHGVYVAEQATSAATPVAVETGVPFFIGASPIQNASNPATPGVPVLATTWNEAVAKLGYSDDWDTYPLCEAMYSHFKLFNVSPAIFCNMLDSGTMSSDVAAAEKNVVSKKVELSAKAIPGTVVVKASASAEAPLVLGTDYDLYFANEKLTIEVLAGGSAYSATTLNVAYKEVTPASVTANVVAGGIEAVDLCMSTISMIPDLIVAPGYSQDTGVAAVMAAKADAINGMFRGKAIVDLSTAATGGADSYDEAIALKNANNFTDENMIVCWPMVKLADKKFHLSTQVAGAIANTDAIYSAPYVSPSNKALQCDSLVDAAGAEILLSLDQANILNGGGIVTGLNFMGGFKVWGNYTACYPTNTDVKDYFIPVSRMVDYAGNTLIRTFWGKLDQPMNRRLIDTILDSCNIWLNGLTGSGYILGGRCEMIDEENPLTNLMAGIVKLHVYITPPSPAQEIDFVIEYDSAYVTDALS